MNIVFFIQRCSLNNCRQKDSCLDYDSYIRVHNCYCTLSILVLIILRIFSNVTTISFENVLFLKYFPKVPKSSFNNQKKYFHNTYLHVLAIKWIRNLRVLVGFFFFFFVFVFLFFGGGLLLSMVFAVFWLRETRFGCFPLNFEMLSTHDILRVLRVGLPQCFPQPRNPCS